MTERHRKHNAVCRQQQWADLLLTRSRCLLQQFCYERQVVFVHTAHAAHRALATNCAPTRHDGKKQERSSKYHDTYQSGSQSHHRCRSRCLPCLTQPITRDNCVLTNISCFFAPSVGSAASQPISPSMRDSQHCYSSEAAHGAWRLRPAAVPAVAGVGNGRAGAPRATVFHSKLHMSRVRKNNSPPVTPPSQRLRLPTSSCTPDAATQLNFTNECRSKKTAGLQGG